MKDEPGTTGDNNTNQEMQEHKGKGDELEGTWKDYGDSSTTGEGTQPGYQTNS